MYILHETLKFFRYTCSRRSNCLVGRLAVRSNYSDPFKLYLVGHFSRKRTWGWNRFHHREEKTGCWMEGDVVGPVRVVRGHPINPQQATSYPLYKVIFLAPALNTVRVPSKFSTIDRTTLDHRNDQSVLMLLSKEDASFFNIPIYITAIILSEQTFSTWKWNIWRSELLKNIE